MIDKKKIVVEEVKRSLEKTKYIYFEVYSNIFDLLAYKEDKRIILKCLWDASSLKRDHAEDLKKLSLFLNAGPIVVAKMYKNRDLLFGVLERYGIPVLNPYFLERILKNNPILIFNTRRGRVAKIRREFIEELRKEGYSLSQIAELLNISRSTLIKIMEYDENISIERINKILEEFGREAIYSFWEYIRDYFKSQNKKYEFNKFVYEIGIDGNTKKYIVKLMFNKKVDFQRLREIKNGIKGFSKDVEGVIVTKKNIETEDFIVLKSEKRNVDLKDIECLLEESY